MKLLFFGDLSYDFDYVAEDIRRIGDYARERGAGVILNLEGAITDGSSSLIRKRGKHLKQSGKCIEALAALNVKGVTLANNHIMDFSGKGLIDTIASLDRAGISHTGAGKNIREALEPMIFTEGEEAAAVFSFGWDIEETVYAGLHKSGCAPRKEDVILRTIGDHSRRNPGHKVIVVLHWGFEYNPYPLPFDIDLAHKLCGMESVTAVIGHHSHCPQPFEIINDKPVFYSLGNLYYSSRRHKYSARRFDLEPDDLCDYCMGVCLDTAENKAEPLMLYYDREKDCTEVREDLNAPLSMPDMDYRSDDYRILAGSKALIKNPVPGTGKFDSSFSFFKYNLKREFNKYFGRFR